MANKIKVNYKHDEEEYNRNDGICDECNAYI